MNTYDQLAYINRPYPLAHPGHLAALARLHGLDPAPLEHARVLDIGASEGGNIIPLAVALPNAEFVGIDLAATPIERGCVTIEALGLNNVRLLRKDLLEVDASFGTFDYIIAHGLYAWTPPEIRDKILGVARANLSPHGIAFISYNTYPGCYLRRLARDVMLFQADRFQDLGERLKAARAMIDLVAAGCPEPDPAEQALTFEALVAQGFSDSALYHDYMSPVFEPVYFRDFAGHAARHGLAYVADASLRDSYNIKLSPEAREAVRAAASQGRIFQEQFLDLLRVRRFRRSLVCHHERNPVSGWASERAEGLHAASAQATEASPTLQPAATGLLRELSELSPRSRPLDRGEVDTALELFARGTIELSTAPWPAAPAGDNPVASPLVRYQAARGDASVSTLRHMPLMVGDANGRKLLTLLDGSRGRDELAREMLCSRDQIDAQLLALGQHSVLLK